MTERSKHSHHEEDASRVGHIASCGGGGTLVIATYATQQAQEKEGHNEGQQEAGNQATQPPEEEKKYSVILQLLIVSLALNGRTISPVPLLYIKQPMAIFTEFGLRLE